MRRVKATPAPKQFIDEQGAQAARQANLKVGMMMGKRENNGVKFSASKSSIQRFVITEKAPTRHYAKQALTPRSLNVKLGQRRNHRKGWAAIRHYAN